MQADFQKQFLILKVYFIPLILQGETKMNQPAKLPKKQESVFSFKKHPDR